MSVDLKHVSMIDLFRIDAEGQAEVLTSGLLALERDPKAADQLEACMRAAHSLKGAARIVGLTAGVRVAHALEDCFVAAQSGRIGLKKHDIDRLLSGVDLLVLIAKTPESDAEQWNGPKSGEIDACLATLAAVLAQSELPQSGASQRDDRQTPGPAPQASEVNDRVLRVTAESLNRLLGLAGESRVKSRWVKGFSESLLRLKRLHHDTARALDDLRNALPLHALDGKAQTALAETQRRFIDCEGLLVDRLADLDRFEQGSVNLSHRLYTEALACRMRPFGDVVQGLPRLVRDLSSTLGKRVKLEISGEATQVDRDILGKLEAPLGHLIRNALDHGIESPEERRAAGKAEESILRVEARHSAGNLHIVIADDGRGVDLQRLRDTRRRTKTDKC